jgi:spastin
MKALFTIARKRQPSVIFFDEIDALMSARKEGEHEASRRLKTEFMTQVDGALTDASDRLLIMGATNLPWDLDEAVLRRLVKRIYVPLPDEEARTSLIVNLLSKQVNNGSKSSRGLSQKELNKVVQATHGYSASDLTALCHDAAMGPIREFKPHELKTISADAIREVSEKDFLNALSSIRPSVSADNLQMFQTWSDQFATLK